MKGKIARNPEDLRCSELKDGINRALRQKGMCVRKISYFPEENGKIRIRVIINRRQEMKMTHAEIKALVGKNAKELFKDEKFVVEVSVHCFTKLDLNLEVKDREGQTIALCASVTNAEAVSAATHPEIVETLLQGHSGQKGLEKWGIRDVNLILADLGSAEWLCMVKFNRTRGTGLTEAMKKHIRSVIKHYWPEMHIATFIYNGTDI